VVRRLIAVVGTVAIFGSGALFGALGTSVSSAAPRAATAQPSCPANYDPVLDPAHFVGVIDNPYFPLPVGRVLVFRGIKDGRTQVDRVTVTDRTKVIEGVTATVITDIAKHKGELLEKTTDRYAQDDQGNVWYLGEDTTAYLPNGTVDTSGSWEAGIGEAEPGIIMEADPQVPDAYRQECQTGEAMDTAWVISAGGSLKVPYQRVHDVLRTLEFTQLEPDGVDQKYYAPGIGIVFEQTMVGGDEFAELVSVTG
jgi:hypothetical protein